VHGHLVAVKVSVETRTNERVQLDSLAFDQLGLERLNTQAVQGWRAVEEHGVALKYAFQYLPNYRVFAVYNLFGALHGFNDTALQEQMHVYAKLAEELKVDVIDMFAALDGKPELLPDRVHPNAAGAGEMAKAAAKALTGKDH
jgi:hypothetical protein